MGKRCVVVPGRYGDRLMSRPNVAKPAVALDAVDELIVSLLRQDARQSFKQIGDRVSLSAPATKRRVDRLVERGVIRGFTAIVDPQSFGWTTQALVQVQTEGKYHGKHILKAITDVPEVVAAYTIAGEASAVLLIRAADTEHLERVLEALRNSAVISRTQTSVILSTLLERPFAPAAPNE
jgi:DNA-binding Lrp family transcriptional regulator